jgi:hypothetical protein
MSVPQVHYKKLLDLSFNPQKTSRPVDFRVDVADFALRNQYYTNPLSVEYGYANLLRHVLNHGVYFRSAENRRQNSYWNPGVNGKGAHQYEYFNLQA